MYKGIKTRSIGGRRQKMRKNEYCINIYADAKERSV